MWSKSFVYVAGFDRGVRPIGDWSMSITLSKHSMPSQLSCSPGFTRIRCSRLASALKTISLTSVDLPEPDTPVTVMNFPTGNSTSIALRLCCEAPRTTSKRSTDRKSTRLNSSHVENSYAVFCLKKKKRLDQRVHT